MSEETSRNTDSGKSSHESRSEHRDARRSGSSRSGGQRSGTGRYNSDRGKNTNSRNGRNYRNDRDSRDSRDSRSDRDSRDGRGSRSDRDSRGGRGSRNDRDYRSARGDRDRRSARTDREERSSNGAHGTREYKGDRDSRGPVRSSARRDDRGGRDDSSKRSSRDGQATQRNQRRVYKNKKIFDQQKLTDLVESDNSIYRGELDPKKGERQQVAPGRKTREAKRAREEADRQAQLEQETLEAENLKDVSLAALKSRFNRCEASPARLAALEVCRLVRTRKAYAQGLIESRIERSDLSAADRGFASLLILGVVSTVGTLDDVINRAIKSPRDISPEVRDAMRISTYEIIFLGKQPHAAIDQGVELVRAVAPAAAGLGNAVLHRIFDMKDTFPFGDPNHSLEALARAYAFPEWLARRLIQDLGAQAASRLMHASNEPAPLFIAVNSIKVGDDAVVKLFESVGATLTSAHAGGVDVPGCYHVSNPKALADKRISKLFSEGKILASDAAAQAVAQCVASCHEGETLLEVGAGRGTKTLLLQSLSVRQRGSQIRLTALDSHGFKSDLLKERAALYGVQLEDALTANAMRLGEQGGEQRYDTVFVDAPCSGLGTLRRHPEIRWNIRETQIEDLAHDQLAILKGCSSCVAPDGQLIYSTCTVTHEENNGVVRAFLESPQGKDFALAPIAGKACFASELSSGSPDAHFAVRFVRRG